MLRLSAVLILLLSGCATTAPSRSQSYFGFFVGIDNAPPPPRVVYVREPSIVMVPGSSVYPSSSVYMIQDSDYDMFRYDATWYLTTGGYWYAASDYRGPFTVVDVRSVPREVLRVPARHWRHPPREEHVSWWYR